MKVRIRWEDITKHLNSGVQGTLELDAEPVEEEDTRTWEEKLKELCAFDFVTVKDATEGFAKFIRDEVLAKFAKDCKGDLRDTVADVYNAKIDAALKKWSNL